MALEASNSLASYDQTTKHLDLSPVLSAILVNDTAFLGLIGMGAPVLGVEHRWNEDSLVAQTVQMNEDIDASETTFTIDSNSRLRVGMLLMDQAAGKTEVVQITEVTNATTLEVTRGFGSTSGETHADDSVWVIIGAPVQEGDETITDISGARTQNTVYCQLFKRTVKISGTAEAEANNGLHPGISSELKYQLMLRADEMKIEMNRAALFGIISAAGSDTVYRSMKGLREYLTAGTANHVSTAEGLSETVINTLYGLAWADGGNPSALVGHADQITKFATFNAAKLRVGPSDRAVGMFITQFLTSYGQELRLITDRFMRTDEVALIDPSRVYLAPLKGRAMFTEPLAKIGDALRWQLMSELTLICRNATQAHAYHSALTV